MLRPQTAITGGAVTFRFRVYSADGDDLDDYTSTEPNWAPGDVLYKAGRPTYRKTARAHAGHRTSHCLQKASGKPVGAI